jgi:hypothetical protein
VSLAFDLKAFRPEIGTDTLVSFAPCVYDPSEKKQLIRYALQHCLDEMQARWDAVSKAAEQFKGSGSATDKEALVREFREENADAMDFVKPVKVAVARTSANLLLMAALLKNSSFREEQEWRLVLPVFADKETLQNPRRFRAGKTTLIPYLAHPFAADSIAPLPLVDLILGPGSDANSVLAAQTFLRSEGIDLIPRESAVPYRSL